jgi:hypothetical protein
MMKMGVGGMAKVTAVNPQDGRSMFVVEDGCVMHSTQWALI